MIWWLQVHQYYDYSGQMRHLFMCFTAFFYFMFILCGAIRIFFNHYLFSRSFHDETWWLPSQRSLVLFIITYITYYCTIIQGQNMSVCISSLAWVEKNVFPWLLFRGRFIFFPPHRPPHLALKNGLESHFFKVTTSTWTKLFLLLSWKHLLW